MFEIARLMPVATLLALSGCGGSDGPAGPTNVKPDFVKSSIISTAYDGITNDLLTAGLGKTGLAGAAPVPASPTAPTVEELRTLAIYNNYRALLDMTANGGYGVLYGPNIDVNGGNTLGEGKVAGEEHIAFADDGTGTINVGLMVQVPSTFNPQSPCIVTAASSGSRGIYGAIGTAGEWGLKHGCAVAYTDKGSGNGGHDLAANSVYDVRGNRIPAATAGAGSGFTAALPATELAAFNAAFPNRWAYKHAHSRQNPEKDWGLNTLQAIQFAFYVLNEKYGENFGGTVYQRITPDRTIVIASSVSNGAGAALAAAEQDATGLIDGVAVAEPQIQFTAPTATIKRGAAVVRPALALLDYFTLAGILQPCAAYAASNAASPGLAFVDARAAESRCTLLGYEFIITGTTPAERAADALAKLHAAGWEAESDLLHASHYAFATLPVAVTYVNAYGRYSVTDNLCGYSFGGAPVAGTPSPLSAASAAQLFGTGNGVPPTGGVNILGNLAGGTADLDAGAGSACLRSVVEKRSILGLRVGGPANAYYLEQGSRVWSGIQEVRRTGNLRGKPAIIVHGRSDALIPVNHTSRPYYALNKTVDGGSRLAYYEVTNAQHFDAFIGNALLAGYDTRLVPLHRYFIQAMDLMWNHLKNGAAIPPSQVVRTTPRGGTPGAAPAITAANVPPIATSPAATDTITFSNNTLTIPD